MADNQIIYGGYSEQQRMARRIVKLPDSNIYLGVDGKEYRVTEVALSPITSRWTDWEACPVPLTEWVRHAG